MLFSKTNIIRLTISIFISAVLGFGLAYGSGFVITSVKELGSLVPGSTTDIFYGGWPFKHSIEIETLRDGQVTFNESSFEIVEFLGNALAWSLILLPFVGLFIFMRTRSNA